MPRAYYVNRNARVGETFGLFADFESALGSLRHFARNLSTHTIRRTDAGFLVSVRGY